MVSKNPKNVTVRGRVSFPSWTHKDAVANASRSTIKQIADNAVNSPEKVKPEFTLLLEQEQLDKVITHIRDVFLPYVETQHKAGEKRDNLDPKIVKKILDRLDDQEWDGGVPHLPIKVVNEKTQALAPECVAAIKITGTAGSDIRLEATVFNEDQLVVPDPDILTYPVRKPLDQTNLSAYPGAYVAATVDLYAFFQSNSVYGISAGANIAFVMGNLEGDRFGGGGEIDEDEIFMD